MKKSTIKKYAKLIVRVGANVKKGQTVNIYASVDQAPFATMLMDEAYKAGAKKVNLEWSCESTYKVRVRNESVKTMSTILPWEEEKLKWMTEELPCRIIIESDDPDGLKGVNMSKVQKVQQNRYPKEKKDTAAWDNGH